MTIPLWVLLAFAVWTLLVLLGTVGVYRWSRILTRRAQITDFPPTDAQGAGWYQRAMRAHANCLENLPVYGAIAIVAWIAKVDTPTMDMLAIVLIAARVIQTIIHVSLSPTNTVTAMRFAAFITQIICMLWMATLIILRA